MSSPHPFSSCEVCGGPSGNWKNAAIERVARGELREARRCREEERPPRARTRSRRARRCRGCSRPRRAGRRARRSAREPLALRGLKRTSLWPVMKRKGNAPSSSESAVITTSSPVDRDVGVLDDRVEDVGGDLGVEVPVARVVAQAGEDELGRARPAASPSACGACGSGRVAPARGLRSSRTPTRRPRRPRERLQKRSTSASSVQSAPRRRVAGHLRRRAGARDTPTVSGSSARLVTAMLACVRAWA